jgi:hypothetical protein
MLAYGQANAGKCTGNVDGTVEVTGTACSSGSSAGVAGSTVIAAQSYCSNVLGVIAGYW